MSEQPGKKAIDIVVAAVEEAVCLGSEVCLAEAWGRDASSRERLDAFLRGHRRLDSFLKEAITLSPDRAMILAERPGRRLVG